MGTFYEFFAGGGMARAGLGPGWSCLFANDIDSLKARVYTENWGADNFVHADIHDLAPSDLPDQADLAWASFPCQDLSIAGNGLGIGHESDGLRTRSGTFWPFMGLMRGLGTEGRTATIIVLENVVGLLTANKGRDFVAIGTALAEAGYCFGAMVVDARHFVPQSRPRVFLIAVRNDILLPASVVSAWPRNPWHPDSVIRAKHLLPERVGAQWVWWELGEPPVAEKTFANMVADDLVDARWNTDEETARLIRLMSEVNLKRVEDAKKTGERMVGNIYLRMRPVNGVKCQRAEVTFDTVSGCIRTPKGGASRPRVLVVHSEHVRSRLLSPREAATLMGLLSEYKLPQFYEQAFRVLGDGLVVPAVSFIRNRILDPIVASRRLSTKIA